MMNKFSILGCHVSGYFAPAKLCAYVESEKNVTVTNDLIQT